jgi:predicted DNA-binding transcriptional regulator YafY
MGKYHGKKDRTARLLKLQMLLSQHPEGMELKQIAAECSVSQRTVYRDLKTIEYELGVPLSINHGKYGVTEGHFLSPIVFSTEEAINIFLAARLMQNLSYQYNPSIASTFIKLNTIVPTSLRQKIQNTLEYMKKQPINKGKLSVFNKLTQAWLTQHVVEIRFLELYGQEPVVLTIEPYFIEPSILGHSSYVIAYCRELNKIYPFKADGIIGDVILRSDTYEIPPDFDAANYLGSEWDIHVEQELETVKLHFNSKISNRVIETTWHPSQVIEMQSDGSMIMTIKVRDVTYFRAFILGWGDDVEVLEPETLREQIKSIIYSLENIYTRRNILCLSNARPHACPRHTHPAPASTP